MVGHRAELTTARSHPSLGPGALHRVQEAPPTAPDESPVATRGSWPGVSRQPRRQHAPWTPPPPPPPQGHYWKDWKLLNESIIITKRVTQIVFATKK